MDDFASYSHAGEKAEPTDWERELNTIASRYSGKSEGEIIREIFSRAAQGKKDGTLTNEQIDAFYARFASMLDVTKQKKLQKLVDRLKEM